MTTEYEKRMPIMQPPEEVFAWLSDVSNLPHYLPPIKEARTAGPAEAGAPGEKIRLEGEIPDRGEFESEGYLSVDESGRRLEWGAEVSRDYSGWLVVEDREDGTSEVTVHLSFGERTVEGEIQEDSSPGRDSLQESLAATLESIRSQLEEGKGKEPQPPQSD